MRKIDRLASELMDKLEAVVEEFMIDNGMPNLNASIDIEKPKSNKRVKANA